MHCDVKTQHSLGRLTELTMQLRRKKAEYAELPERAKLEKLLEKRSELRNEAAKERIEHREQRAHIERLKQDIGKMRARRKDAKNSLGAETDRGRRKDLHKDLESTERRLAAMEKELAQEQSNLELFSEPEDGPMITGLDEAREQLETAEKTINNELTAIEADIAGVRKEIDEEILAVYDLQEEEHGIGAAILRATVCQSCFMELDPLSLKKIRQLKKDEVARCPECSVILLPQDVVAH